MEKLKPTLEAHLQRREFDLLRYCAAAAAGTAHRIQMPGKELEYQGVDLHGNLIDAKDFRGKFVLLIIDASQNAQKIPVLKKIYNALHSDGLELIEFNTQHNTEITSQHIEQNEIPWIVTSLGARHQKQGVQDYREVYGNSDAFLFAGKDGIVISTAARGAPPMLFEMLQAHFPNHTAILEEAVAEARAIDDEQERKLLSQTRTRLEDLETFTEGSNLTAILRKLFLVYDTEGISAQMKLELAATILQFPNLPESVRLNTVTRKAETMFNLGIAELRRNPEKLPEVVFAELLTYLDEVQRITQGTPLYHNAYLFTKIQVLLRMREYLNQSDNPVAYAEEIIDRYIPFAREEMPNVMDTGGAYNLRFFVMFFLESLEKIDSNHSTQLSATFLGQVIPIFEASPDLATRQYARQLSGTERRASLVGQELEFESVLIDGETINVQDLRGKVVLVNFWATTCGPCRAKFPNLKRLYEHYKPLGFEMIAYSCGDDDETLRAFAEREQLPWLVGSLLMSTRHGFKNYDEFYGIRAIPTTFLLDRGGVVRFMMVGANDETLNREIAKLFDE
ncbi:MAG: redoxin family protein [Planctomycetaceae bacterium]|nr:redoxin family protein [Planctomycetaceae bacterium]